MPKLKSKRRSRSRRSNRSSKRRLSRKQVGGSDDLLAQIRADLEKVVENMDRMAAACSVRTAEPEVEVVPEPEETFRPMFTDVAILQMLENDVDPAQFPAGATEAVLAHMDRLKEIRDRLLSQNPNLDREINAKAVAIARLYGWKFVPQHIMTSNLEACLATPRDYCFLDGKSISSIRTVLMAYRVYEDLRTGTLDLSRLM